MKNIGKPLSLLEVHYRRGDEEAMAAGSCPDACYIKVRAAGVRLLYSSVCIACAWLHSNEKRSVQYQCKAYLR